MTPNQCLVQNVLISNSAIRNIKSKIQKGGVFGFPKERCAEIMLRTVIDFLKGDTGLKRVVFCLHGESSCEIFSETLARLST